MSTTGISVGFTAGDIVSRTSHEARRTGDAVSRIPTLSYNSPLDAKALPAAAILGSRRPLTNGTFARERDIGL